MSEDDKLPNRPKVLLPRKEEEEHPLDKALNSIERIPDVIEKGINRYFEHNEHKQESKERLEVKKLDNERHEGNLKVSLLVLILICAVICYLTKGLDQQITGIICFLLGYVVNGFSGVSLRKKTSSID